MDGERKAEDRGQKVRRIASITEDSVVALCPLIAVCVWTNPETRRKVTCGHYHGSITNSDGSKVMCGYPEQ